MLDFVIRCAACADDSSKLIRLGSQDLCVRCAHTALDAASPVPAVSYKRHEATDDDVLAAVRAGYKWPRAIQSKVKAPPSWIQLSLHRLKAAGLVRCERLGQVMLVDPTAQHAV